MPNDRGTTTAPTRWPCGKHRRPEAGRLWNIASNWSPNTVPGSGDTVYLTNAGSYAVSVNVNATLGDFFIDTNATNFPMRYYRARQEP